MEDLRAENLPASPPDRATRALEGLVFAGAAAHALLLSISTAGMYIGLAVALGALVLLAARGVPARSRGRLDLPVLLLAGGAVFSVIAGWLAGSTPFDWRKSTSWFVVLSPLVLYSAIALPRARGAPAAEDEVRRRALWLLGAWAAGSFAPSALAWAQYATGFDPLFALGLRSAPVIAPAPMGDGHFAAVGFFRWYTALAHNLLPPLCVAFAVALHGGTPARLRWLLGLAVLGASAAIVLTVSRAAWATLVGGVLLAVLLGGRGWRWALAIAVAAGLGAAAHPALRARVAAIGERQAISDRQLIWSVCGEMVRERPLTGWGWGNVPRASAPYWDRIAPEFPLRAWCHDAFFTAWAEGGPVLAGALAAYWVLLLAAFWRWRRAGGLAGAAAAGALAGLAATLVNSLVHDVFHSAESALGLGFAIAVAAALASGGGRAPGGAAARPARAAGGPQAESASR
jgi:O-antigen ligase